MEHKKSAKAGVHFLLIFTHTTKKRAQLVVVWLRFCTEKRSKNIWKAKYLKILENISKRWVGGSAEGEILHGEQRDPVE